MRIDKTRRYFYIAALLMAAVCSLNINAAAVFAQDQDRLDFLTKKLLAGDAAVPAEEINKYLREASEQFLAENKFDDCAQYLRSIINKNKQIEPAARYYIAFVRYSQLKHLEQSQDWDEYFNKGNEYRGEILESAQFAADKTTAKNPININAMMIIWRMLQDQSDTLAEPALLSLIDAVTEYSKEAKDVLPVKECGDLFLSYGDKQKARDLYKLYIGRLNMSELSGAELKETAGSFYKEVNLDLAETAYDVYIEKVIKTMSNQEIAPALFEIARQFSCAGNGPKDMVYAEKIFQKIEESAGAAAFDEQMFYLRARNLIKIKEFHKAKDIYTALIKNFPGSADRDKAVYQTGIIYTYVLGDLDTGVKYFEELSKQENTGPEVISSLYQLGLLNQRQGGMDKAAAYYNKLRERANGSFSEKTALAEERLKEVTQRKPIDYSLRMFLDAALGKDNSSFDRSKVEINSSAYSIKPQESFNVALAASIAQTGCMQVEMQYLWSGDLGSNPPLNNAGEFDTWYKDAGVKEINLVVVSAAGIIDYNIELIEVD